MNVRSWAFKMIITRAYHQKHSRIKEVERWMINGIETQYSCKIIL